MTKKIADSFVAFLQRHQAIHSEDREIYVYGCELAVYTFLSTVGLLLIGLGFGRACETAIWIALFYLNQTMGGGYHATTHFRCFFAMAVGLLVYIATFSLSVPLWANALLGFGALAILLAIPLVLHNNKQCLIVQQAKLKMRSRVVLAIEVVGFGGILMLNNQLLMQSCAMSLVLCAVSRYVGFLMHDR